MRTCISLLAVLALALPAVGQTTPVPKTEPIPYFAASFKDGDFVKMTMLQPHIVVETDFGKLTVPFSKIVRIEFGCRKETKDPAAQCEDKIYTGKFAIVGRIQESGFKVSSKLAAESTVKLEDLAFMHTAAETTLKISMKAAEYGSNPDQWLKTSIMITRHTRLLVTGEGLVNLYPKEEGTQYTVSPKGYTSNGRGYAFSAGALIGRIGETGPPFFIGERYEGTPDQEGCLYLHIVSNTWNDPSTGEYRVMVNTGYAFKR